MMEFWNSELEQTVHNSKRLISSKLHEQDVIDWLSEYRDSAPTSSNQGTSNLPFQRWFKFKEAFSPKFVADTLGALPYKVDTCLDPFLGSGTTAVTCRMLGINSIGTEVNPFLADLIEAKLTPINTAQFVELYEKIINNLGILNEDRVLTEGMPRTLTEPGVKDRYVFSISAYETIRAILRNSYNLPLEFGRLLRVLLGSVLVENSNVVINGKGRRYRKNWTNQYKSGSDVIRSLDIAVDKACADITRFSGLPQGQHAILRGDTRGLLPKIKKADAIIFSPPYPNSFDYTDVYNLELWMLDYLKSAHDNKALRNRTFRSHVQSLWNKSDFTARSSTLFETISELERKRALLWNKNIPEMVTYYFDDLYNIFFEFKRILDNGHHAIVAIGDSRYADVHIDVATILQESVADLGFQLVNRGAIRSMRSSSQNGGKLELSEHCLVFEKIF
ncbi:site-specific DNA-methyltransferase [Citrobacter braakii]|nr:site-specific DNA-methyltransferase [Citrobacter braakii]